MTQIIIGENEGIESALRRFKKKIQKAGLLADIRRCQYHETPAQKLKRKAEEARRKNRFRRREG
ncbi:MAG: 30S ribosomal protein S21 [Pseudanabaenaceae cyanobacterium bins.68]|nr:30S ribosomal protein S21 [Pseudanabaenaceae cyanobacterium bins.68]